MPKIPCTIEVLTRNSERTLARCLESVKEFAEILVVDGNSTDSTRDIARSYGARIISQVEGGAQNVAITDFSAMRNKGLHTAAYPWFMFIDSDEYISEKAVEEIRRIVENPSPKAHVWWQPRKYVLYGNIIQCATTYPNQQIRFFHKDFVEEFIKPVHERIKIKKGAVIAALTGYEYVPVDTLAVMRKKWRRYADIELSMNRGSSRFNLVRLALRQAALVGLYMWRYVRNVASCHGLKMPLKYELIRHVYSLKMAFLLLKMAVGRMR